jgi:peroxiredoxin Q/BCP
MAKKKRNTKSKKAPAVNRRGARVKTRRSTKAKRVKAKHRVARRKKSAPARRAKSAKPKRGVPAVPSVKMLPNIEAETTSGDRVMLSDLKGNNVVLYFYPKDDTPGCTTEGCDIRDRYADFRRLETVVYGISRDGIDSHERFKAKFGFPFELIADPDEKLCRAFGVIQQKSLYGRTYLGVDRSTFIFDKTGKLRKSFRGVKVPGHVNQVLEELRKL